MNPDHLRIVMSANPPLDPDLLPATAIATPAADNRREARLRFGLAGGAFAVIVMLHLLFTWAADPLRSILESAILPALLAAHTLAFVRRHRHEPERLALTLSRASVAIESEQGLLDIPMAEFAGVAVRHRVELQGTKGLRNRTGNHGIAPERIFGAPPVVLTHIVLVHPDEARTVPLWGSRNPRERSDARAVARRFAAALGKPLLGSHVQGEEAARIQRGG